MKTPNFDRLAKKSVTFENVLKHESGLASIKYKFPVKEAVLSDNIKKIMIGEVLERQEVQFPPEDTNTKRQYHSLSRNVDKLTF